MEPSGPRRIRGVNEEKGRTALMVAFMVFLVLAGAASVFARFSVPPPPAVGWASVLFAVLALAAFALYNAKRPRAPLP